MAVTKINLQLIPNPTNDITTNYITTAIKCNPKLQLVTQTHKTLHSIYTHLHKKWGQNNSTFLNVIDTIRLIPLMQQKHIGLTNIDKDLTVAQLLKQYGTTADLLQFYYKFDVLENDTNVPHPITITTQPIITTNTTSATKQRNPIATTNTIVQPTTKPTNTQHTSNTVKPVPLLQSINNTQITTTDSIIHTTTTQHSEFAVPKQPIQYDESLGWLNEISLQHDKQWLQSTPLIKQHSRPNMYMPIELHQSQLSTPYIMHHIAAHSTFVPTPLHNNTHTFIKPIQKTPNKQNTSNIVPIPQIQPFSLLNNMTQTRRSQLITDSDSELSMQGHSRLATHFSTTEQNTPIPPLPAFKDITAASNTSTSTSPAQDNKQPIITAKTSAVDLWHCSNKNCTKSYKRSSRNTINKHVQQCQYNPNKIQITNNSVIQRPILQSVTSPITRSQSNGVVRTLSQTQAINTPNKQKRVNDTMRQLQWLGNAALNNELMKTNIGIARPPTPGKEIVIPRTIQLKESTKPLNKRKRSAESHSGSGSGSSNEKQSSKRGRKPKSDKLKPPKLSPIEESQSERLSARRMSDGLSNWAERLAAELSGTSTDTTPQHEFLADAPNLLADDNITQHSNTSDQLRREMSTIMSGYNIGTELVLDTNSTQYQQYVM